MDEILYKSWVIRILPRRSLLLLMIVASLIASGCSSAITDVVIPDDENPAPAIEDSVDPADADDVDENAEDAEDAEDAGDAGDAETDESAAPVEAETSRDDVECTAEALGEDADYTFDAAYYVVDGQLGDVCFGEADSTVEEAFDELAIITPQDQLADLALFAGFSEDESAEEITAAFVNVTDDEGTDFQMSINIADYASDPNEAALTMAHEFAHVFTLIPNQIDRSVFDADDCDTYFTYDGCFYEDSIINQWVVTFWGDGLIDEIDPDDEPSNADGEDRCDINPGFFGPYAASNPEEDFAETFSAYVYQLEPDTAAQQVKLDWIDAQPGLAEFRQRAIDADRGPLVNNFEVCG